MVDGKFLFKVGLRSEETFLEFYDELPEAERYYTDNFKLYDWLPFHRYIIREQRQDKN